MALGCCFRMTGRALIENAALERLNHTIFPIVMVNYEC
jgi:hypothetical protein